MKDQSVKLSQVGVLHGAKHLGVGGIPETEWPQRTLKGIDFLDLI